MVLSFQYLKMDARQRTNGYTESSVIVFKIQILEFNLNIMQIQVIKKCQVAYVNQGKTIK